MICIISCLFRQRAALRLSVRLCWPRTRARRGLGSCPPQGRLRPCPDLRWRRPRPVTCRRAGRPRSPLRWRRARQDGAGGAGAVPQPGQGQRPPLPPERAARRAALPGRALRLRPQQAAAGHRVRALPAQVPAGTRRSAASTAPSAEAGLRRSVLCLRAGSARPQNSRLCLAGWEGKGCVLQRGASCAWRGGNGRGACSRQEPAPPSPAAVCCQG